MKIKCCGIKYPSNYDLINSLDLDYIGFILTPLSTRKVEISGKKFINKKVKRVGVFVEPPNQFLHHKILEYELDAIQLHGNINNTILSKLPREVKVIRAISIHQSFDFTSLKDRKEIDMYLMDTAGAQFGGNGERFDWNLLKKYNGTKPFMIAGGIGLAEIKLLKEMNLPNFIGVDVNSKFEFTPGVKNIQALKMFIDEIRK